MNNYRIYFENIDTIEDNFEAYGHIISARKIISEVCSEYRTFNDSVNYIHKICNRFSLNVSEFKIMEIPDNLGFIKFIDSNTAMYV